MEQITKKKKDFLGKCAELEELMKDNGALVGHECDEALLPLNHTFMPNLYMREIFMPKGTFLTSKIHKTEHPYFLMKGECSILTEKGWQRIKAPYVGITKAGTKRVIYVHEDCNWITLHATEETDLEKIEDMIISKDIKEIEGGKICLG